MKLMFIVNTSASAVTARTRVVIQKALSADHEVTLRETNRRGHATRLAQGAAADGADVVVVLGGDGTLNEAANGLAGTPAALAVLPGGSTNVFARTIGMANDPIEATSQLLSALSQRSFDRVGLGQANGRYFLFHAGVGFDAAVVARVERLAPLKRWAGPAVFALAAALTWANGYDRRKSQFCIDAGQAGTFESPFAICLNTDPYTFFGSRPLSVAEGTSLSTALSLVSFGRLTIGTILGALAAAALDGGFVRRTPPHVRVTTGVETVMVTSERPFPYQVDGDYVGEVQKLHLRWAGPLLYLVKPL